ncbi:hypothetical protein [Polyangium aurulentum]|uniref:hypothetical protein n=1 Tax=Polyangium aurulentum TaxID=2567896 RepID=UPI0010AEA44C|nr:hypothetical protein [Polyangium aurulentum]UQA56865.1 hypothetical protein E8A73_037040 [Polyangium aurulentum]
MRYPVTPDGRYFVVRGRLWRCSNPALEPRQRAALTKALMRARSDVRRALGAEDRDAEKDARARVHEAKVDLGERGPVWWSDGAPDYNRHMVWNTPYADWYAQHVADAPDEADLTPPPPRRR